MRRAVAAALLAAATGAVAADNGPKSQPPMGEFEMFNVLGPEFQKFATEETSLESRLRDGVSFEWEYHMVHAYDEATGKSVFDGMVCVVLFDPRGRLELGSGASADAVRALEAFLLEIFGFPNSGMKLVPTGGNVVFVGKWADEDADQLMDIADFANFPRNSTVASHCRLSDLAPAGNCTPTNDRQFDAAWTDPADPTCANGCKAGLSREGDALRFTGTTQHAQWNFSVAQDWADRAPSPSFTGDDWAKKAWPLLQDEWFTINMPWMRSSISGTVQRRNADGTLRPALRVEGHGYRENSWGQWLLTLGGWDFGAFSRRKLDANGNGNVLWSWQSYYNEKQGQLDHLDVSWCEKGEKADGTCVELHEAHYNVSEFAWHHPGTWNFSLPAAACVPTDARVIGERAEDGGIRVDATVDIGRSQTPILFPTYATTGYVINEWLPEVRGTISRCEWTCHPKGSLPAANGADLGWCGCDWQHVTSFEGPGGGELSIARSKGLAGALASRKPVPLLDATSCDMYGKFGFQASLYPRDLLGKNWLG